MLGSQSSPVVNSRSLLDSWGSKYFFLPFCLLCWHMVDFTLLIDILYQWYMKLLCSPIMNWKSFCFSKLTLFPLAFSCWNHVIQWFIEWVLDQAVCIHISLYMLLELLGQVLNLSDGLIFLISGKDNDSYLIKWN